MRLMHRLVRQHGLAHDVANGEDVRHVGAHLDVDVDEATVGDGHASLVGSDLLAVGGAAHGLQHEVVGAFALACAPSGLSNWAGRYMVESASGLHCTSARLCPISPERL